MTKRDTKWKSFTESAISTKVGYWLSVTVNAVTLPFFAADFASGDPDRIFHASLIVGMIFTAVSLVRQFAFRRMFAKLGYNENFYTLSVRLYKRICKNKYGK